MTWGQFLLILAVALVIAVRVGWWIGGRFHRKELAALRARAGHLERERRAAENDFDELAGSER
jgi:hypothetical protein